jgi:hypothetical protein
MKFYESIYQRKKVFSQSDGQSLLLCWYFIMSSPEPLLIEKLMMKITTKADRIPSAGYGLIAI